MGLRIEKLEKARRLAGGVILARCPACAAAGKDREGKHLKVWPDGRFGCVVFPGAEGKWHRKEIWAAVGEGSTGRPALRLIYTVKTNESERSGNGGEF